MINFISIYSRHGYVELEENFNMAEKQDGGITLEIYRSLWHS